MADIIISIAAKVSEYLVDPAIREWKYLFCAGRITKNAENEKEKLKLTRDEVSRHAKEAERKAERIEDAAQNWQKEVESLLTEVENMEQQVKASSCFRGLCPTWRRYRLCKQLTIKTKRMTELNNNSKFERFSRLATLPTIEYFSSGNFTLFESTKLAYNQLLEALRDNSHYMICLYGMGGCGKTTLAKEVGKKAKDLNLFENVVFTTVSQTPDVKSIQDEIADFLSLRFEEQSKAGRARRLSLRLQSGERILVILDDVWAKLNLEDIGIPLDGNLKGCKVLLTTRLQQLCTLMECQRNVPLHPLLEEEGWVLFQKKACLTFESSFELLNDVARQVALECKGLPIAIEAVGTSLKGKPIDSWKDALNRLRHSKPVEVEEGVRDAFTCLQYSYDHLKIEEAKGLFLMCSMFPEDHDISTEDLFRYAIGLGLCKEVQSLETSRSRVNNSLNYLVDSSLLIHSERRENHFKMHDMVRDVALWISSKEDHTIMVAHEKGLSSLALDGVVENCSVLSSWYAGKDQFPHQLDAPKLEILLLNLYTHFDISDTSFEGTKKLKVMAIISVWDIMLLRLVSVSLPQSTQWLTNLQTLRLVNCELGDISFVVSLRSLEILDLRRSEFKSLPHGIEEQNKLKLLDLSDCITDDCCDEVLERCSQLEELYVYPHEAYKGSNGIISSYKCFMENASFQKLQRYVLQIGEIILDERTFLDLISKRTRVLLLNDFDISYINAIVKSLLQRAEVVVLDGIHGDYKSIFPELVQAVGSMEQLIELCLSSCTRIESIISTTHVHPVLVEYLSIFQKLERVCISDCPQLQSVFGGDCNLCNLKYFYISKCPRLTSLFPISVAQTLKQLESIEVYDCFKLRHIILMNEENHCSDEGIEISSNSEISDIMFPKLKCVRVRGCALLQFLLPVSFHQGHVPLQDIVIKSAYALRNVFGNQEELGVTNYGQMKCLFPREWKLNNLKVVCISCFPKLISLFSVCVAQTLQLLEMLEVKNCKELKYILFSEAEDSVATREEHYYCEDLSSNQNQIQIVLPKLKKFNLINLPSFIEISSGNYYLVWPSLVLMEWRNCPNLITLCGDDNIGLELRHPHLNMELKSHVLEDAQVANEDSNIEAASTVMNELSIDEEKYKMLTSSVMWLNLVHIPNIIFIWINFQNIDSIKLIGCRKLKSLFSASVIRSMPELSFLIIEQCDELEEVISNPDFEQVNGNPSSSTQPRKMCFPNLEHLRVKRCNKMKCIFALTKRASDETHDGELIEFLLPKLESLTIVDSPSLVDICGGFQYQFQLQLQNLHTCKVRNCPNFSSTTIATLNNFTTVYTDEETEEEEEEEEYTSEEIEGEEYTSEETEGEDPNLSSTAIAILNNFTIDEETKEEEEYTYEETEGEEEYTDEETEEEEEEKEDKDEKEEEEYTDEET